MIRLEEKYEQAVQFRKRGFTYSEIAKIVGVSKGTVSNWLAKKAFSKKVKEVNLKRAAKDNVKRISLINKARKAERAISYVQAVQSAETEYKHYKEDLLFIAGLAIYISCGGIRELSRIRISSPSFFVHEIMIRFFVEYLGVNKEMIHFWLLLPEQNFEKQNMKLWSKKINLPIIQFYKTQFRQRSDNKEKSDSGAGNMLYNNAILKKKLLRWIELFEKDMH